MKITLIPLCILAMLSIGAVAQTSPTAPPVNVEVETPKIRDSADLRKFLQQHPTWYWAPWKGKGATKIEFQPNGICSNHAAGWVDTKYVIVSMTKIKLVHANGKKTGYLTFSPDYKTASIQDFTGRTFESHPVQ